VTVIGGGGSDREGSAAFGTAAVTVIGGATRGGSARAASTALGAAAVMVADAGGRDVTRDGTLERAGVTYDVAGCTMVATDGSYGATAWLFTAGSTNQWKPTAQTV
jgi:hypothetical protein